MFITVPREEGRARLRASGYVFLHILFETTEVWRGPDGVERLLTPEFDGSGDYEERMIELAERLAAG